MRIAIPEWDGYVSPVLDTARRLLLIELDRGAEVRREAVILMEAGPSQLAAQLLNLNIDAIICCSISRTLEASIVSRDVKIVRHICGPVEEAITAFATGGMIPQSLIMPGCSQRRRRW
jgi:predicted Fe-Mo cluster-binding NifX family protein